MTKYFKFPKLITAALIGTALLSSCKDDEVDNPHAAVNNWIYNTMKEVYYWTDDMPANPNRMQAPEEFFEGLKSSEDRFSHIQPDYQALLNSLSGVSKEAGYEFLLSRVQGSETDVVAVVLYIKENSPANEAGLKRGDVITSINGTGITMSNYESLIGKLSENHSVQYLRYNEQAASYEEQEPLSLEVVELAENPNYLDTVYTVNGHKIGYYVYNFFSAGTSNSTIYDTQMDEIISGFKAEGVQDVILDLRYNSGGAISSATNLASLIGRDVNDTKIFYENRWNSLYQEHFEGQPNGDDILRGKFKNKAVKIGDDLPSGRIYVLVGSRTASASELIINGLKPYMDVYLIGEQTVGKNVGSVALDDEDNPGNTYGILPIVFRIYNSQGSSDYAEGFIPNDEVDDFQLPMEALGDLEEPLLARAVEVITGSGARIDPDKQAKRRKLEPIVTSLDTKLRTNRLFYDYEMPVQQ